jgi:hypothetical protein
MTWAEEDTAADVDSASAKIVVAMPEFSVGLACNFLAIPTVDKYLTQLVPADLLFSLGIRGAIDYAPYMRQLQFNVKQADGKKVRTKFYFDHVGWSYRFFAAVLLDKSVGLLTEAGASRPVAGDPRVKRNFLRFGFLFNF